MNLYSKLVERQDNPLRIGLIGAGKFAAMYLAQVPKTPGVKLVAIADLSPAGARENLKRVGWDLRVGGRLISTGAEPLESMDGTIDLSAPGARYGFVLRGSTAAAYADQGRGDGWEFLFKLDTVGAFDLRDEALRRTTRYTASVRLEQSTRSRLRLENGRAEIVDFRWHAEGNELRVSGGVDLLAPTRPLNLAVDGDVDLRILGAFATGVALTLAAAATERVTRDGAGIAAPSRESRFCSRACSWHVLQ